MLGYPCHYADASIDIFLDNGFSTHLNTDTRSRVHASTVHAQWMGLFRGTISR